MDTIGSKPTGVKGRLAAVIMNLIHANQYKKIIPKHILQSGNPSVDLSVLDIGCGGGKAVNIFHLMLKTSKIYGIDHSLDMVNHSKKVNKIGINKGNIEIVQADAKKLPYSNGIFDIVTAFDTISFWDDIDNSINEIKRVLKDDGIFVIVNGYPRAGTKWYKVVKFKNDNEYRSFLSDRGFNKIDIVIEKNTIIIKSSK